MSLFTPKVSSNLHGMGSLNEITDQNAVNQALAEFLALGRNSFLAKYGLQPSRDYFVVHDGVKVDSKPLLSVAYGYQFPQRGPLSTESFRGGVGGVLKTLERLGLTVVTAAQETPPQLGDTYPNRTALYDTYGGNKMAGIIRFPGEDVVNIFSDAEGPYVDDPPSLASSFGYRGEGLTGPQRVETGGNALLEKAMQDSVAARYWYRPKGQGFSFMTWVAVLGRSWVNGVGQDKVARPEIEWCLQAVPSPIPQAWSPEIHRLRNELREAGTGASTAPEARPESTYRELVERVETRGQQRQPNGVVRADYPRSISARNAVLKRSNGQCEGWCCTGMPAEKNRQGQPILDVDHIEDLALGGSDHPANMVALCPNCHASKTRTARPHKWRKELLKIATVRHAQFMADIGPR